MEYVFLKPKLLIYGKFMYFYQFFYRQAIEANLMMPFCIGIWGHQASAMVRQAIALGFLSTIAVVEFSTLLWF